MYGTCFSSHRTGRCVMTSSGVTSPAIMQYLQPFPHACSTSLAPEQSCFPATHYEKAPNHMCIAQTMHSVESRTSAVMGNETMHIIRIGMCAHPLDPFRSALTTSFTPLLMSLRLAAFLATRKTLLAIFSSASGDAMGMRRSFVLPFFSGGSATPFCSRSHSKN